MARFVIFCAGGFESLLEPLAADDFLLAADGGYAHFEKLNRQPDGVLGDFDSLGYVPQGAKVFPVEKDDTDAMLAVRQGLSMGYREFLLYGSLDGLFIPVAVQCQKCGICHVIPPFRKGPSAI